MKLLLLLSVILFNVLFSMTGLELATLVDSRLKPLDIKSKNTMKLIDGDKIKKTYELITKSKDNSKKQMIWFLQPAKNKGTAFLKIEHEDQDDLMTMWLPGFRSDKRIRTSEKSDSFMGSDLSFEDLTNRDINDYKYTLVDENALCTDCDNKSAEVVDSGQTKLATIHLLAAVDDLILMTKPDASNWPEDKQKQLDHLEKMANQVRNELRSS